MKQHRALKASSCWRWATFLLAWADHPTPKYGLLIRLVLPGGACAGAGLRPGDVLLDYDG